ncbi:cyclic nucleotide-binding protein [Trypanosoma theileri]|uniref:Cyclic nucleotide-binding protein n=1 Tax=Trypanosoma theileri TaxID=67003 RepID=A0A1X0NTY5_9TRYP|nr:cyclic nucleotide-binding protein [Trypanosoma theileri]ORC88177.1 cyclic nucleotide-binding protein [Trypanosoma theileri]
MSEIPNGASLEVSPAPEPPVNGKESLVPKESNRRERTISSAATSLSNETMVLTPRERFARVIEKVLHTIDERAKRAVPKHYWHEEDSVDELTSCMIYDGQQKLEPPHNVVLDTMIAKGIPVHSAKELLSLLQNTEHLHLLRTEELCEVVRLALRREYIKGEVILPAGSQTMHVYVVIWGEVDVFAPDKDSLHRHHHLRRRHSLYSHHLNKRSLLTSQSFSSIPSSGGFGPFVPRRSTPNFDSRWQTPSPPPDQDEDLCMTHCGKLKPGMLFGFDACVFEESSALHYVAGNESEVTVVALLPLPQVKELLRGNVCLAQSVGHSIAQEDIFIPVREFCRYVFAPTPDMNEYLPLWTILNRYTKINNVIHTKLFSGEIDTAAWGYALKRLPENVTTTFCFDLVLALPPFVATRMREEAKRADVHRTSRDFKRTEVTYIRTKERRRCTWHLGMEGKALVLLRDGFTDLLDFLSMLCVHIIESNKLRSRVQGMVHPPAIDVLDDYLRNREIEEVNGCKLSKEEELNRVEKILSTMPLDKNEQSGLLGIWHSDTLGKIYEVMMHREEFNVRVDPSVSRKFQTSPFHEWALNLRACIMQKMGLDRNLPPPHDLCIDIVSSNTHCIKNLLSGFHRKNRHVVEEYARNDKRLGNIDEWHTIEDALYASTASLLATERQELKEEYVRALDESGITVLTDTAMTGLQVDVIPVHALNFKKIDTVLQESLKDSVLQDSMRRSVGDGIEQSSTVWRRVCLPRRGPGDRSQNCDDSACYRLNRHFIINMDFAFGAQAEGICQAIFSVFGSRIRSVSVMGKAGGLTGRRGDIQLPRELVMSKSSLIMEDAQDELRRCRNQDFTAARLRELAGPSVEVHEGRVVTIAGTMLQNVRMLQFYKNIWGCVGAEMEGSYFARVIEDMYRQGIANPNLITRFAYYTSDLPLACLESASRGGGGDQSLSAPMSAAEGVPPLYAIARGILERILLT